MNMNRVVKIISPQNTLPSDSPAVSVFTYIIPITNSCSTIYDTVDSLKNKKFLTTKGENIQYPVVEHISLRNVLNIHNDSGIKDLLQIRSMVTKIQSGEHILSPQHHVNKIRNKNWKNYVINWQAPINKQLCSRIQKNIGELYDALSSKIS